MRCAFAGAWASWQGVLELELPEGATVADALLAAQGVLRAQAGAPGAATEAAEWQTGVVGIFGEVCSRDRRLQDGDRVELYRPLQIDPKSARRARAAAVRSTAGSSSTVPPQGRRPVP
jgi:putative ubiquitin-RnfH superfamily antitoxin RatB of RatAB toxin-antitoxin module